MITSTANLDIVPPSCQEGHIWHCFQVGYVSLEIGKFILVEIEGISTVDEGETLQLLVPQHVVQNLGLLLSEKVVLDLQGDPPDSPSAENPPQHLVGPLGHVEDVSNHLVVASGKDHQNKKREKGCQDKDQGVNAGSFLPEEVSVHSQVCLLDHVDIGIGQSAYLGPNVNRCGPCCESTGILQRRSCLLNRIRLIMHLHFQDVFGMLKQFYISLNCSFQDNLPLPKQQVFFIISGAVGCRIHPFFVEARKLLVHNFVLSLFVQGPIVVHPAPPKKFRPVVLAGHGVPIALQRRGKSCEFIHLFVAGNALDLLFSQKGILLVLLILGYDKNNLLYFGFQEEQGFLDLQLVGFEGNQIVNLCDPVLHVLPVLVVVSLSNLCLQFGLGLLQIGEDLSLQILQPLVKFGNAIFLDQGGQLIDPLELLVSFPFAKAEPVLNRVNFGPHLDQFGFDLVDLVFDGIAVVFFVMAVHPFIVAGPVKHLQILCYFLELHLEVPYLVTPLLDDVFHLVSAHTVAQVGGVKHLLLANKAGQPLDGLVGLGSGERVFGGAGGTDQIGTCGVAERSALLVVAVGVVELGQVSGVRALQIGFYVPFDPFLNFPHKFDLLLGLHPLSLLIEDLDLLNLVCGQFELVLEVAVLVFEQGGLLDDLLGFHLVFLFIDLIVDPVLLHRQDIYVFADLLQLPLLVLYFFLELQLRVEQLLVESFYVVGEIPTFFLFLADSIFQPVHPAQHLLDTFQVVGFLLFDGFFQFADLLVAGLQFEVGGLNVLLKILATFVDLFENDGEVLGQSGLHNLDDAGHLQLFLDYHIRHFQNIILRNYYILPFASTPAFSSPIQREWADIDMEGQVIGGRGGIDKGRAQSRCNKIISLILSLFLIMESLREHFERAWRGVIAPVKYSYNISSVFAKEEILEGKSFERVDLHVTNDQGKNISALLIKQKYIAPRDAILYFHGNGGTKIQILGLVPHLASLGIALIAFDYVGCGNSDEGYLTYGVNEASDAQIVLRQAYKHINVERLSVWGRSMGAVTAINFAVKNPKIIDKLILDSPFRYLDAVIKRVIKQQTGMPQVLSQLLTYFLSKEIEDKLKFPLFKQDYLALFKKSPSNVSTMFICSQNDIVVPKHEVQNFYRVFKGDKELLEITQSHEQDRGPAVYSSIVWWIRRQKNRKNMKLRLYRPADGLTLEEEQVYSIC